MANAFIFASRVRGSYTKYLISLTIQGQMLPGEQVVNQNGNFTGFAVSYGYSGQRLVRTIDLNRRTDRSGILEFEFDPRNTYDLEGFIHTNRGGYRSQKITISTITPPNDPPAPSTSIIEVDGVPHIKLNIKPPSHWGGGTPSMYGILYWSPEDQPIVKRSKIVSIAGSGYPQSTNYIMEGLIPDKNYVFQISARNEEVGFPSQYGPQTQPIYLPLPPFTLFDKSSWQLLNIPTRIKNQLNKAADSWTNFITINPEIRKKIRKLDPLFNGIRLQRTTGIPDQNKSAVACVPNRIVSVYDPNFAQAGCVSVSFSMRLNPYYYDILTDYDWELAFTHQLGHALGLGFINKLSQSAYPTYQLDGANWPNAQRAYNTMRVPPFANAIKGRTKIPLDHLGPTVTDDVVGFDGTPINTTEYTPQTNTGSSYWHWGILRNNYTRATFFHPADHINHDIMGYRVPNQDKMISLLSIKALVDMGYSEVSPNNYQIKRYTTSMPQTTITNKQLCSGLGSLIQQPGNNIEALSLDVIDSNDSNPIIIGSITRDSVVSYLEPDETNACIKWYCSESGCVSTNVLEFASSGNLYDTLEECEDNCTDSAGILSAQYTFDAKSQTWRIK